ncbi:hypothetical protein DFH29DRAFT_891296 [Suillus ampliporus]|nr:hypothetical protein DFH29DRAFT_891296 [Suillus ampliporus]
MFPARPLILLLATQFFDQVPHFNLAASPEAHQGTHMLHPLSFSATFHLTVFVCLATSVVLLHLHSSPTPCYY